MPNHPSSASVPRRPASDLVRFALPRLVLLVLAAMPAVPLAADEPTFELGLSAGPTAATGSDRFDAVLDEPWPEGALELAVRRGRWSLEAVGSRGETSGFETRPLAGAEPVAGRIDWLLHRLDLGAVRTFRPERRWGAYLGAGPTAFVWREEHPLVEQEDGGVGAHLTAGVERRGAPWSWRLGLRFAHLPDGVALYDGASAVAFEDLDIVSIGLSPRRTLARRPPPAEGGAGRWSLRAQAVGVFPTHDSRRQVSRLLVLTSEPDSAVGAGVGGALRLVGPLRLSWDVLYARPGLDAQLIYTVAGTSFPASGELDMWGGILGLDVRLVERGALAVDLTPLVAFLDYEGETSGEFDGVIDRDGWNVGLGLAAEIGRGRWALRTALRHLAIARIEGFPSGFELEPISFELGTVYRLGQREER